jgi:hypothetical protein
MGKALTSPLIKLGTGADPVRFSFCHPFKPKPFGKTKDNPRFQCTGLLDPSNKTHAEQILTLKAEAKKLLEQGGLSQAELKSMCFGKGDKLYAQKKDTYEAYQGMVYLTSSQTPDNPPDIRDRRNKPVKEGQPQAVYSGCFGILGVTLWLQNNDWGKRINANFLVAQFVKDGPKFGGGGVDTDNEFQPLDDDDGSRPAGATTALDDNFDF